MSKCINVKYEGKPLYNIVIEQSFDKLAEEFDKLGVTGRKLCIVSDSNVAPLYAKHIEEQLLKTGNKVFTFVFEAGEANKNLDTVEDVYEFLIKNHFDRKDMLVALGGGVVGDLTGFTAATYLRGISFIQVPTSLLAQVDSSIGGKTGVDFRAYKNMVGAFYQPKLVYMNISVLKSLSDSPIDENCKPIQKYGSLGLFRSHEVPKIKAIVVDKPGLNVACGAIGIGEITSIPTAPAIADAYFRYDGIRRYELPLAGTPYERKG